MLNPSILILLVSALLPGDFAFASLQEKVAAFKNNSEFPAFGAAKLTGEHAEIATAGVRKLGESTPVMNSDKWHLGSMTKSMTALLVAVLIKEKKLSWSSTPAQIFPELEFHEKYRALPITRLLTHTAGILDKEIFGNQALMEEAFAEGNSLERTRFLLTKGALSREPTAPIEKHLYSNVGFIIVGAMIERAGGESWEALLTKKVFAPLVMSSCGFGPTTMSATSPAVQPWEHKKDNEGKIQPVVPGAEADNHPVLGPAGTVHCSLADVAKYAKLHLDQNAGRETSLALSDSRPLYEDQYQVGYTPGALVFETGNSWAGGKLLWHNGSNTFNYAIMMLAPARNKAVIGVVNSGPVRDASVAVNDLLLKIRD